MIHGGFEEVVEVFCALGVVVGLGLDEFRGEGLATRLVVVLEVRYGDLKSSFCSGQGGVEVFGVYEGVRCVMFFEVGGGDL